MRQLGPVRGIAAAGALVGLLGLAACGTSAETDRRRAEPPRTVVVPTAAPTTTSP